MFPQAQQPQQTQYPPAQTPQETFIGFMGIRGRNGSDPSLLIPNTQCVEAKNVDWYQAGLGRRRGGAISVFNNDAYAMYRHVPSDDQTLAELWWMGADRVLKRYVGGVVTTPTMVDPCTASPQETVFQSFNGKLYIAYKSAHNRLHVWDPVDNKIRRVGLDLPPTPTTGAPSGGAVTDTRKYRVAWTIQSGGVTVRRSNLSVASGSVSLAAQQVVVTRGTAPGEGETHWELYAASTPNFADYRLLATTVIATTTATDNNASLPSTVAPSEGANTPPPSARYLVSDDARIIMGGAWELAANAENAMVPKTARIWWTSILGASDVGDDERVSNTGTINNYADLEESIAGISQPMQLVSAAASSLERGSFYVFSFVSQWKFVSTGTSTAPYLKFRITGGRGTIHHKTIVTAEDENGNPSIYWTSTTGEMRISISGQEFVGEDNIDLWANVNLDALIPAHATFFPDKHQVWVYYATGTNLYPNAKLVLDTRFAHSTRETGVRGGWSSHDGESAKARCSCLFSDTIGATVGRKLKPHVGYSGASQIWKCDTTDTNDNTNLFQAFIESKSYAPWGLGRRGGMTKEAMLIANPSSGVTVFLTILANEGAETLVSTAVLTPISDSGSESKVFPIFGDSRMAEVLSVRFRVGDNTVSDVGWSLDGVIIPVVFQGER